MVGGWDAELAQQPVLMMMLRSLSAPAWAPVFAFMVCSLSDVGEIGCPDGTSLNRTRRYRPGARRPLNRGLTWWSSDSGIGAGEARGARDLLLFGGSAWDYQVSHLAHQKGSPDLVSVFFFTVVILLSFGMGKVA